MPFQFSAQNIRRITTAQVQTDARVNILMGENMEGKTSLLGAMIVALTGSHPRWMAKQGQSIYDLRHGGAKTANLVLTMPHPTDGFDLLSIEREISARAQKLTVSETKGNTVGLWPGTMTEQQKLLYKSFGLTADQLTCLLDSGQFLEKSAREQTAFLAALSGVEFGLAELNEWLHRDNPAASAASIQGIADLSGIALLDACLKQAETARRDTKRDRDAAKTRLADAEAAIPEKPEGEEPENPQERAAAIQTRTKAADEQRGRIEAADAAVTAAEEKLAAHTMPEKPEGEQLEDLTAALASLNARINEAAAQRGRIEAADKAVAKAREQIPWRTDEQLANRRTYQDVYVALSDCVRIAEEDEAAASAAYRTGYAAAGKAADAWRSAIDLVAGWETITEPCCPTCKRPVDSEFVGEQLAAARVLAVVSEEAHETASEAIPGLLKASEDAKNAALDAKLRAVMWGQYTKAVGARFALTDPEPTEALNAEAETLGAWTAYHAAMDAREKLEWAVAAAVGSRDALDAPEATEALDAEWEMLDAWSTYLLALQTAEDARAALAKLETAVEHWEWLVGRFASGPDSYRAKLTEGKLGDLETAVNQVLEPLLGERVVFPQGDSPLSLQGMGQTYPATDQFMSGSEKLRVQVALQYAFCRALDWDLLLIDVEAMLDYATSGALMTTLKEIAVAWPEGTIFVTTAPRDPPDAPEVPGWQSAMKAKVGYFEGWARVWEVDDGRVTSLVDPDNPFDNPALTKTDPGGTAAHGTDGEPAMQLEIAGVGEGAQ